MAEIGLASAIVELAVEGFRIYKTAKVFLNRAHSAQKDVRAIATDVQSTSETLHQLADCLGKHGKRNGRAIQKPIWRLANPFSRTLNL
jgi:hypothetical protein